MRLLSAMAKAVAVVAVPRSSGMLAAGATGGVASYSIDPPSILASVPPGLLLADESRFGVSLLSAGQHAIARDLWGGPHEIEAQDERFAGSLLVEDALARIECSVTLADLVLERGLLVGRVIDVAVSAGRPLLAGGLFAA